jgi:serine/threonine protein kinase
MAVEILRGSQYNFSVDWWSIGIIYYEMLAGLPPFYAPSPMDIFSNIMEYKKTLIFPELTTGEEDEDGEEELCMSKEAWRLIRSFITEPNLRLGRDGFGQIKKNKFFEDVDWNNLLEVEPPFVPELEGEADYSYFVTEEGDNELNEDDEDISDGRSSAKDPNFIGFTFKNFNK